MTSALAGTACPTSVARPARARASLARTDGFSISNIASCELSCTTECVARHQEDTVTCWSRVAAARGTGRAPRGQLVLDEDRKTCGRRPTGFGTRKISEMRRGGGEIAM